MKGQTGSAIPKKMYAARAGKAALEQYAITLCQELRLESAFPDTLFMPLPGLAAAF